MTRQQIDALRDAAAQLAHADGLGEAADTVADVTRAFEIATDDERTRFSQGLFAVYLSGQLHK